METVSALTRTLTGGLLGGAATPAAATVPPVPVSDPIPNPDFSDVAVTLDPMALEATVAVDTRCELGEGSIWDRRCNKLLWVDILKCKLMRFDPTTGVNEVHDLSEFSEFVSTVVPLDPECEPTGDLVGITVRDGFATYSFSAKSLTKFSGNPKVATGQVNERFNDGKVDPLGRFWAGTIARDPTGDLVMDASSLYMRGTDGKVTKMLSDVTISNGIAWTADCKTMYYTDTPKQEIAAFDFDVVSGAISNRRTAVPGFTGNEAPPAGGSSGFPDGNCLDYDGNLWSAAFNGGGVRLYQTAGGGDGSLLGYVKVPEKCGIQVTSVAVTPHGDVYMTTANEGMDAEYAAKYPLAGSLCVIKGATLAAAGLVAKNAAPKELGGFKTVPPGSKKCTGKVCVVTGSSKGIGKGVAIRLAREGAKVVINYRSDPEGAKAAAAECEALGGPGSAIAIHANLGKVADCVKLIDEAAAHFGTLDVLVNNAGYEVNADFWNVQEKDWDGVLDVNLKGPFFTAQAFVKKLMAWGKKGTIINMSSVHEDLPFPGFAPYCCSKGGMKMMTRNLMVELAPLGITINNVAPGAIATPINQAVLDDPEKKAELMSKIPLKRLGVPGDIGACVVYLASDEATYLTGTTIFVDGGLTWFYEEKH